MKIFSVFGISGTGKTTTIENIIRELKRKRYSVGSIKEIHFEDFAIDTEGTNTHRHREAGSELVVARGYYETDLLYFDRLPLEEILKNYSHDYVVIEGIDEGNFPKIITAGTVEELEERLDDTVFAICGLISKEMDEYRGIPVINAINETERLVSLIEEKVFAKLPDFPSECCTACGFSCRELGKKILAGEAKRDDCVITNSRVKLYIGGQKIEMVPFVQKILHNAVKSVVSELDGYKSDATIKIEIGALNEE